METVERIVLSQRSLLDMCLCNLCSVLVFDVNWIADSMLHQLARPTRHWTRANVCSFSMAKFVQSNAHSCSELEEATWFLVATGFLSAVTQQHQQLWLKPTQGLWCLTNSQLSQLSTLQRRHSWVIWPFAKMKTLERMVLQVCLCNSTGDGYKLGCSTTAAKIRTGKTLN